MELIPILATIILVATISTFFLSIGAYILFKIREKRGVEVTEAPPATIQAELVTPEKVGDHTVTREHTVTLEHNLTKAPEERSTRRVYETTGSSPAYAPRTDHGYSTTMRRTYDRGTSAPARPQTGQMAGQYVSSKDERRTTGTGRKFVKITSEENSEQARKQKKEENKGALKWR